MHNACDEMLHKLQSRKSRVTREAVLSDSISVRAIVDLSTVSVLKVQESALSKFHRSLLLDTSSQKRKQKRDVEA